MKRRVLTAAAVAAVTLCGVLSGTSVAAQSTSTSTSTSTSAEASAAKLAKPAPIDWGRCSDPGLRAGGAKCGYLTVPLDWSKPNGTTIKIAVSRVLHTVAAADYQGVMVTNPGGPGGSGLYLATYGQYVPNHAGDAYDWIGFDPRGVGESQPHVSCIPDYFAGPRPEYIPSTQHLENVWLARSKSYAQACAAHNGPILDHLQTADVAKDIDYLRVALGQKQINYYGFSYGTYLGQVYSTLFPSHVRRMVLDSTIDPRGWWYQDNLDQDIAFQKTDDIWFAWLAKYNDVYHLGKTEADVSALYYQVKQQLAKHPAAGVVGPDEWNDIALYAGYYEETWLQLGNVFASWVHGHHTKPLLEAYNDYVGPSDDNGFAIYLGVQCTDAHYSKSWPTWRVDNWRTYAIAPFEAWDNAWFNGPCLYWPAPEHTPVTINGSKVKSVLMIDETLDAATPYPGSLYVRSLYPGASLIAEPGGTSHADTLFGDACVDDQIAAYLANGTKAARKPGYGPDTTCKPLPKPVPTASSLTRQKSQAATSTEPSPTQLARMRTVVLHR